MVNPERRQRSLKATTSPYELSIVSHDFGIGSMRWEGGRVLVTWHAGSLSSVFTDLELLEEVVGEGTHIKRVIQDQGGVVLGYEYLVRRKPSDPTNT